MFKHRWFLLGLALCVVASPALGQVLVQEPPAYEIGERKEGLFINVKGIVYRTISVVEKGEDGKPVIVTTVMNNAGSPISTTTMDPRTLLSNTIGSTWSSRVIRTTCSNEKLYPITVGKIYECSNVKVMNGKPNESVTHLRFNFDRQMQDPQGTVIAICNILDVDDNENRYTSRICWTPDTKWRFFTLVESMASISEL